ncbi:hypothetical protein BHF71_02495 [Vulcanibacillus modesticaldus]|uniref:Pilus assembly protein n=1 Tax=Vulcanibacillus modesticaldus TaxID=337097 RepID=A0A1D2YTU3_9BACI|nr:TadE family protein [Vulcanibacillus modesticaldus]OEF99071.1 hypothetical protein BHF71_02495 [Vulcanibacillus modesticaldus]
MFLSKKEEGSMVVEASLIMPVFLSFLIFLITMIQITTVEIALNNGLSEAVKQISTHMYPLALVEEKYSNTITRDKSEIEQLIKENADLLPLNNSVRPIVDRYMDDKIIKVENLQVTKVILPNLTELNQPYLGIEVKYEMPLRIPFISKVLIFEEQVYERVWLGDRLKLENRSSEVLNDSQLYLDYISSPVQRGKFVRIIANGPPNRAATITLTYKSGFIKEKSCRFDDSGRFTCDIKIGGNSKEGKYVAVIRADDLEARGEFIVLSKKNIKKYIYN